NDYIKDTLFIGDSNTVRMMSYGHSTLDNNVSAASMGIQHVISKPIVFFKGFDDAVTVPKAVSIIQPKRIIITYGTNNTIGWSASTLVTEYKKAIDAILKAYPYTDVIINAVPPIDKLRENVEITMQTIDGFNKALAEFAKKEGYKFLNSAETLKDAKTGYAKTDYTISDGVHLSKKGMDALFKYVRTHTFETDEHRKMPLKPVPGRKETPPNIITEDPLAVREQKKGVSIVFTNANPDNGKMKGETKQTVKAGETCTEVTALPNEGFVFTGWGCTEGRIEDVTNPLLKFTVPPTKEKEIVVTASFAPAVLSLTNDSGAAVTAATLEVGNKLQLRAAFAPNTYKGKKDVSFASSNTAVATVDATGIVTALSAGEANIVCTGVGKMTSSVKITVTAKKPVGKPLTGFTLSDTAISVEIGKTTKLSVKAYEPADTTSSKVAIWVSDKPTIAMVDANGVVTGVAAGSATVTCTVGGIAKTCAVTVKAAASIDKPLESFTLSASAISLETGNTAQLSVTAYLPADTTSSKGAAWVSGDTAVATVDGNGVVTAKAVGSTTVTCTVSGKTQTCAVTVTAPKPAEKPLTDFTLAAGAPTLDIGGSTTISIATVPGDTTTTYTPEWFNSNPTAVSFDGRTVIALAG
ncbi:MAG: Ig-like domain-containing protein, partial [Oscillospiraceae bacterium]